MGHQGGGDVVVVATAHASVDYQEVAEWRSAL
jgi:hypothetical protein